MKTTAVLAAALFLTAGSVMAQTSNPTVSGSQTAPSNSAGMPGATAPSGQMGTSTISPGSPTPAGNVAAGQTMTPSTGSTTTTPNVPAATK